MLGVEAVGAEAVGKVCGVPTARLSGEELGTSLVDRMMVNTGTASELPFPPADQAGGGQARCQLMALRWGGACAVVRGRESFDDLPLDQDDEPRRYSVTPEPEPDETFRDAPFWVETVGTEVEPAPPATALDVDLLAVRERAGMTGTVWDASTDEALPGAQVSIGGGSGSVLSITDEQGRFLLEDAPVAPDGAPRAWTVTLLAGTTRVDGEVTVAGTPVELTLSGTHPSGSEVGFRIEDGPGDGALTELGAGRWHYTPDEGFTGQGTLTYVATPDGRASAPETVTITVTPAENRPPGIEGPEELRVPVGQEGEAVIRASDADGDALGLRAEGLPDGATFTDLGDGTGVLTYAPGPDTTAGAAVNSTACRLTALGRRYWRMAKDGRL